MCSRCVCLRYLLLRSAILCRAWLLFAVGLFHFAEFLAGPIVAVLGSKTENTLFADRVQEITTTVLVLRARAGFSTGRQFTAGHCLPVTRYV